MAKLGAEALKKYEASRNLGEELMAAAREIKAGKPARVHHFARPRFKRHKESVPSGSDRRSLTRVGSRRVRYIRSQSVLSGNPRRSVLGGGWRRSSF